MIDKELVEAVLRGAALLDVKFPDWAKVDFDGLEMSDCCNCTLGKIFSTFDRGLYKLELKGIVDARKFGFHRPQYGSLQDWRIMRDLWIREIEKRRKAS